MAGGSHGTEKTLLEMYSRGSQDTTPLEFRSNVLQFDPLLYIFTLRSFPAGARFGLINEGEAKKGTDVALPGPFERQMPQSSGHLNLPLLCVGGLDGRMPHHTTFLINRTTPGK
jgi:hypothetical protein